MENFLGIVTEPVTAPSAIMHVPCNHNSGSGDHPCNN
jgi:hypothetical protein